MGRLGPLNSLAFGRSPFQLPEFDGNGDFILGAHAHDLENKDHHVQVFDAHGHPKNDASRATIRAMQHAQNVVLETVGVVVRREEASKSDWQRQSKKDKLEAIIDENDIGVIMREVGPFLMQSSMWWAVSLRRRMQAFRSYLGPPVLQIVRSELNSAGLLSFVADGLLPAIASYVLNIVLVNIKSLMLAVTFDTTQPSIVYPWMPLESHTAELILQLIVFTPKAFAVLQSLHLIPSTFFLSPWSFVPFTAASPIQFPSVSDTWSIKTGFAFAVNLCYNPFVVSSISDLAKSYTHRAMYRIILLALTPRPSHPDRLTIKAAKRERDTDQSLRLNGIGLENDAECLNRARSNNFWTELRRELGSLVAGIKRLRDIAPWLKPSEQIPESAAEQLLLTHPGDAQLRLRSEALQIEVMRSTTENLRANEETRLRLQRQAHARALEEFGISYQGTEDDNYLLPWYVIMGTESTATPEPVDISGEASNQIHDLQNPPLMFGPLSSDGIYDREEREGEGRMMASMAYSDNIRHATDSDIINSSWDSNRNVSPSMRRNLPMEYNFALQAQTDHPDAGNNMSGQQIDPPLQAPEEEAAANNELGIPEAPDSPLDRTATPPAIARVRTDQDLHAHALQASTSYGSDEDSISSTEIARRRRRVRTRTAPLPSSLEDLRSRSQSLSSEGSVTHNDNGPTSRHRVTMLSVFPAEMFAECLAGLITTTVTLPLDTLYVRSLVHGFLSSPSARPGASVAALGLRSNVYGMDEWFGGGAGGGHGRLRYAGLMALMMGLQACVSSLAWTLATKVAIMFGRQSGWGQL